MTSSSTRLAINNMPAPDAPDETSPLLNDLANPTTAHQNGFHKAPSAHSPQTSVGAKIAAAMYSFVVLGLFTSSIGVMLPRVSHYYSLSDIHVSLIFLANPVGYVVGAQSNDSMHAKFGQRGVGILGPVFHILCAIAIAAHPPFPAILLAYAGLAVGIGLLDGSWCSWAAGMDKANTVSGLLHGSFSPGAAAGPFLAEMMISKGHRPWYEWYYVLVSVKGYSADPSQS